MPSKQDVFNSSGNEEYKQIQTSNNLYLYRTMLTDSGQEKRFFIIRRKYLTDLQLGREAKTEATDEFKELELEMAMRQEGTCLKMDPLTDNRSREIKCCCRNIYPCPRQKERRRRS